jgi:hypothetical protein
MKARRVAAHANIALVDTIFEVRILNLDADVENCMFQYAPKPDQLMRGRSKCTVPACVQNSLKEATEDACCYHICYDPMQDAMFADTLRVFLCLGED